MGRMCLLIMFWLTAGYFVVEIVFGYIANSLAMIVDSLQALNNAAALFITFLSMEVIINLTINNNKKAKLSETTHHSGHFNRNGYSFEPLRKTDSKITTPNVYIVRMLKS